MVQRYGGNTASWEGVEPNWNAIWASLSPQQQQQLQAALKNPSLSQGLRQGAMNGNLTFGAGVGIDQGGRDPSLSWMYRQNENPWFDEAPAGTSIADQYSGLFGGSNSGVDFVTMDEYKARYGGQAPKTTNQHPLYGQVVPITKDNMPDLDLEGQDDWANTLLPMAIMGIAGAGVGGLFGGGGGLSGLNNGASMLGNFGGADLGMLADIDMAAGLIPGGGGGAAGLGGGAYNYTTGDFFGPPDSFFGGGGGGGGGLQNIPGGVPGGGGGGGSSGGSSGSWLDKIIGGGGGGGLNWGNIAGGLLGGLGGALGGSRQAGTTTSTISPWEPMQPYMLGLANDARGLYQSQQQNPIWNQISGAATDLALGQSQNPLWGMGNQTAMGAMGGQFDPSLDWVNDIDVSQQVSPYLDAQAGDITNKVQKFLDTNLASNRGNAQSVGAYGSSRHGIADARAMTDSSRQLADSLSNLYGNAFENQQNRYMQGQQFNANLGMGRNTQTMSAANQAMQNRMNAMGLGNQAYQGQMGGLTDAWRMQQANQQQPWQNLQNYQQLLGQFGGMGRQSSEPYYENKWGNIMGGVTTGAQFGGLLRW